MPVWAKKAMKTWQTFQMSFSFGFWVKFRRKGGFFHTTYCLAGYIRLRLIDTAAIHLYLLVLCKQGKRLVCEGIAIMMG